MLLRLCVIGTFVSRLSLPPEGLSAVLDQQSGVPGKWMVWDRELRGPASLANNLLVHLTREQAEIAHANLEGKFEQGRSSAGAELNWQVIYSGGLLIDCQDEKDARRMAQGLLAEGRVVSIRLQSKGKTIAVIEGDGFKKWVAAGSA